MKVERIAIDLLHKAEWNYKTEDAEMSRRLVANIKRNGVLQVSLVYEDGGKLVVLDGNHRLDAYKTLGMKTVPCLNLGKISHAKAQRFAIEINETKFDSDKIKLSEVIKNIADKFGIDSMVESMPYTREEMEQMRDLLEFDWNQFGEANAGPDIDMPGDKPCTCPQCGHVFVEE